MLRADNGGEFCENEFEEFYKKRSIERKKTTPYTPHQNGVSKRINKRLMKKESCMLSGVGLGK